MGRTLNKGKEEMTLIKEVYIPEIENEEICYPGRKSSRKIPVVKYKKQNWAISAMILDNIKSGEIKLKDYHIENNKLYIDELEYRRG